MPTRAANGRFQKSGTRTRTRTTTAVVVAAAPRSPAKRRSSSPYVVASKRRRASGGSYAPGKSFAAGGVLGIATTKFKAQYDKLPEIAGTRMIAAAGLLHMVRGKVPHGSRVAESAASIAGWEAGKANAGKMGISGDDEF